jgi:hypothetical protein
VNREGISNVLRAPLKAWIANDFFQGGKQQN